MGRCIRLYPTSCPRKLFLVTSKAHSFGIPLHFYPVCTPNPPPYTEADPVLCLFLGQVAAPPPQVSSGYPPPCRGEQCTEPWSAYSTVGTETPAAPPLLRTGTGGAAMPRTTATPGQAPRAGRLPKTAVQQKAARRFFFLQQKNDDITIGDIYHFIDRQKLNGGR